MQIQTQEVGVSTVAMIALVAVGAIAVGLVITNATTVDRQLMVDEPAAVRSDMAENNAEIVSDSDEVAAEEIVNMVEDTAKKAVAEQAVASTAEAEGLPAVSAESSLVADPAPAATVPGIFTDYDPSLLAADKTNVLFFHANWCPSCRSLENDLLSRAADIPGSVNILKLDYDSETELKKQYGVIRQHTLVVVDANGNEIKKLTGLTNTLEQVVSQL